MPKHCPLTPRELQIRYEQGQNISALLREQSGSAANTEAIIETAYDLQTGSYVAGMADPNSASQKAEYTAEAASCIARLCRPESILEAGVGEATTLSGIVRNLGGLPSYGFDLSWSRIACARNWLFSRGILNATLCTGSLLNIPLAANSIDVVYTSHSIEPNGGREAPILQELYRVARKYLVLLEPSYELATDEGRRRMESHGYCRDLPGIMTRMGWDLVEHRLMETVANPLNPTAITIVRKDESPETPYYVLACPKFKTPLEVFPEVLFSPEALVAYPVIAGIPCLRIENGIVASEFHKYAVGPSRGMPGSRVQAGLALGTAVVEIR